ncbi:hypothetical protein HPP92_020614, partial [Vanilla planifolia]
MKEKKPATRSSGHRQKPNGIKEEDVSCAGGKFRRILYLIELEAQGYAILFLILVLQPAFC